MEIKAGSVYDLETMKAFSHYMIYKKREPKRFFTVSVAVIAALVIIAAVEMAVFGLDTTMVMAVVLLLILAGLSVFLYFVMPKLQYKNLAQMRDAKNEFVFRDDGIEIKTEGDGVEGEAKLGYDGIFKAAETSGHFFIYQSKVQVLVVDKKTIDGGGADKISEKLHSALGDRYVRCKY